MMYHFPHFQPIAGEHFKYRADRDELVAEAAEQSDFIRSRTMNAGSAQKTPRTSWGGGGGKSLGGGGNSLGGGGNLRWLQGLSPEPEPAEEAVPPKSDEERAREARLRRFG